MYNIGMWHVSIGGIGHLFHIATDLDFHGVRGQMDALLILLASLAVLVMCNCVQK